MGKLTGPIQITGTVGGLTFRRDGTVASKPASRKITAARSLENNAEFGRAGSYGKLIRDALRALIDNAADSRVASRLTAVMRQIIGLDDTNDRGQRVYDSSNVAPLVGFEFNAGSSLASVFLAPYAVAQNGAQLTLSIPALDPLHDLLAPQGATHYELLFGAAAVDTEMLTSKTAVAGGSPGIVPLNGAATQSTSLTATFDAAPAADHIVLGVLAVKFYQQVNNKFYSLQNGSYNAAAIDYAV